MNLLIRRALAASFAVGLALLGAGCQSSQQPAATPPTPGEAFASPDAAVDAMVTALRASDRPRLEKIFGSDSQDLLSSGDPVADANGVETFLAAYDQSHRLTPAEGWEPGQAMTLEVGNNQWPTPIPVVKDDDGWRLDTAAGLDEMLNRRIGRNELDTIQTCHALADAQREYLALNPMGSPTPHYADRLFSTEGKRDGLFWPTSEGETQSPVGQLLAEAFEEGYRRSTTGEPVPYHGYRFRLLTAQGKHTPGGGKMNYLEDGRLTKGWALVAYPADYGNSGLKTFMINQLGVVYQRDLGDDTEAKAKAVKEFDPGPEWEAVEEVDVLIIEK